MAANVELELLETSEIREKTARDLENAGLKLTKFYKLTSDLLKLKFEQELDNLKLSKLSDFDANIKYLYHGTTADLNQICEEGLDERLSRKGRFGRGIYFSDDPIKCCKYAEKKEARVAYLLICKVILGDIKEFLPGEEDRSLTKEPLKLNVNGKRIFYDSVKGMPLQHTEYVIYEKRRALIEYIANYERLDSTLLPRSNSTASLISSDKEDNSSDSDCSSDDGASSRDKHKVKENREKEQRAALTQLVEMKGRLKPSDFNELVKSFVTTYGKPIAFEDLKITSEDKPVKNEAGDRVIQEKMKEFSSITQCNDTSVCKIYLENNNYRLEDALNSYFEMH